MVTIRELKARLREALGIDWKAATPADVAPLALLELAQLHLAELNGTGNLGDAMLFIQRAAGQALQRLMALGLPEPSEEDMKRLAHQVEAMAAEFEASPEFEALAAGVRVSLPPEVEAALADKPPSRETEAIAGDFLEQLRTRSRSSEPVRGCEGDEPGRLPDDGRIYLVPESRDDGPVVPMPATPPSAEERRLADDEPFEVDMGDDFDGEG